MTQVNFSDVFFMRVPLCPIYENDIFFLDKIITSDLSTLIKSIFSDRIMQEGIFLASHSLYISLRKLLNEQSVNDSKTTSSLFKYWVRMSTRTTPFGLFSGVLIGHVGKTSSINLKSKHLAMRLDFEALINLCAKIEILHIYNVKTNFFSNPTLLHIHKNHYHYIEYLDNNSKKDFISSQIELTDVFIEVLEKCQKGANRNKLESDLSLAGYSKHDLTFIIDLLIENQLLYSEYNINVTGEKTSDRILKILLANDPESSIAKALKVTSELLESDFSIENYEKIEQAVSTISAVDNTKSIIQADLYYNSNSNSLPESFFFRMKKTFEELVPLFRTRKVPAMETFIKDFDKKYGMREISLLEALDLDIGIGYKSGHGRLETSTLIDNIFHVIQDSSQPDFFWNEFEQLKTEKFYKCKVENKTEVLLNEKDLAQIEVSIDSTSYPLSMYVMGNILAKGYKEIDEGNYEFNLQYFSGPSGANLLGRFAGTNKKIENELKKIIKKEETTNENVIYAEISHLPNSKTGNILARPCLREHEISFFSSGTNKATQILLNDLFLKKQNNKILLFSKSLNKEIIPRLSSAYVPDTGALPILKFLYDLQFHNQPYFNWDWGHMAIEKFLPRVKYKSVILSRATWNLAPIDYEELIKNKISEAQIIETILALKEKFKITTIVCLAENDNEFVIDFSNSLSCLEFFKHLKKGEKIKLIEFPFDLSNCFVKKNNNSYTSEVIFPISFSFSKSPPSVNDSIQKNLLYKEKSFTLEKRFFPIGDEWLYVKIYCTEITGEYFITKNLPRLIKELFENKLITKWFYIRYYDEKHHLRLRFFKKSTKLDLAKINSILLKHRENLINTGFFSEFKFEEYEREIERYSPLPYNLVENLFEIDSQCILDVLTNRQESLSELERICLGLYNIDNYLTTLKFNIKEKLLHVKNHCDWALKEFGDAKILRFQINLLHRTLGKDILQFMQKSSESEVKLLFDKRQHLIDNSFKKSKRNINLVKENILLVQSLIHMSTNRLFYSEQRKYELLCYEFLYKYYISKQNIEK